MRFPFFSMNFKGSAERDILAFFRASLFFFCPKKARIRGSGLLCQRKSHSGTNREAGCNTLSREGLPPNSGGA